MHNKTRLIAYCLTALLLLTSCSKRMPGGAYQKEDAGNTGYGASQKSALYIDDFYFVNKGTSKSNIELLNGNAHYFEENNELKPIYILQNGDYISIQYEKKNNTVESAEYTYSTGEIENFFDILVELGVLSSNIQESQTPVSVEIPNEDGNQTVPDENSNQGGTTPAPNIQEPIQGEVFATGTYDYNAFMQVLTRSVPRSEILRVIGRPNYFSSHNFSEDSYIIDCYNLSDGRKLYLDYGYERLNLRCAALYSNGTYSSVLDSVWSAQKKPTGFTRSAVDINKISRLPKNSAPAKVYSIIGEPAWYEGNRGSYSDVYRLNNSSFAYLNFGSAHNRLSSVSIKNENGSISVITLN